MMGGRRGPAPTWSGEAMSYVRAAVNLIRNNPHTDALPAMLGFGRDWPAEEPRELWNGRSTFDMSESPGWRNPGQFEYLDKIKAWAPCGAPTKANMALEAWTLSGTLTWVLGPQANYTGYQMLECKPHATPGKSGTKTSNADFAPAVDIGYYVLPPDPDDPDSGGWFQVKFLGDGSGPVIAITIPCNQKSGMAWQDETGETQRQLAAPLLRAGMPGQKLAIIDKAPTGTTGVAQTQAGGADSENKLHALRVEYDDEWVLIRLGGAGGALWAYRGKWIDIAGVTHDNLELTTGKIAVTFQNIAGSFYCWPLVYPSGTLKAAASLALPSVFNPARTGALVGYARDDTSITATLDPDPAVPSLAFVSSGAKRAIFYNLQEYREATFAAGTSAPANSTGDQTMRVQSVRWDTAERWRGSTLDATIETQTGDLYTMAPNAKYTLKLQTVASDADPMTQTTVFTGYGMPSEKTWEAGALRVDGTLHCGDFVAARLAHKPLQWHCSYAGWPVDTAWKYILNRCGVPAAMMTVAADITEASMGDKYYLPYGSPKGDRIFEFRLGESAVTALDAIALARDLEWGVDRTGQFFLRKRWTHTLGASTWTIDEEALDGTSPSSFRHVRTLQDYWNVGLVLAGQGFNSASRMHVDHDSVVTPADAHFVGDDWWRVETVPDTDDADVVLARLLANRLENEHLVYFTVRDFPAIEPDDTVAITVSNVDISAGSIFRVRRVLGSIENPLGACRVTQEVEAAIVEEA